MHESVQSLNNNLQLTFWQQANRQLVAKILSEFMYEDLLISNITLLANDNYQHYLELTSEISYQFTAKARIFGSWQVDANSIKYFKNNIEQSEIMVAEFICNSYQKIGIDGLTLGHLLRELNHTLIADCHILNSQQNFNHKLLDLADCSLFEGFMRGHPWFVINKGRLGFSYAEYLAYAPEMANLQRLNWIAVLKSQADFNSIPLLDYEKLITKELNRDDLNQFQQTLQQHGVNSANYYFMPIHKWQWQRQIIQLFADDIARKNIVWLGESSDNYLPTQSIRSFNNQSTRNKFQVKLPLSIFNTAVYRGLPNQRTKLAPLLSNWIKDIVKNDEFFNQRNLIMLGEIASINFSHTTYNQISGVPYQYQELLGVIWRENVNNYLQANTRVITMAALIHIDNANKPFVLELIERSGLSIETWLDQLFNTCIPPLLHWLYKYGVVYSPHGENTMLVLDQNNQPYGLVLKDFIDDVNISQNDNPYLATLPEELQETLYRLTDKDLAQFIQTGLFVVLYRYLSDILASYAGYSEAKFWQQVTQVIEAYHVAHPEFKTQIDATGLLAAQFKKLNLNRLRLLEVGYADYAERPKVESKLMLNNPANSEWATSWDNKKSCLRDIIHA